MAHGKCSLNGHLLGHIVENMRKFSNMGILDAFTCKDFNVLIKQSYISTSKRLEKRMDEKFNKNATTGRNLRHSHNTERIFVNEIHHRIPNPVLTSF